MTLHTTTCSGVRTGYKVPYHHTIILRYAILLCYATSVFCLVVLQVTKTIVPAVLTLMQCTPVQRTSSSVRYSEAGAYCVLQVLVRTPYPKSIILHRHKPRSSILQPLTLTKSPSHLAQ
jgi:hypothetical protein